MIATRFRSVYWVGGVAVAALGCYLVSQRVAAERASLAQVETAIVVGQRQIRALETEIGTRAGMKQIERWNVEVLSLSAPKAGQFVINEVQLASMMRPVQPAMDAPAPVQVAAIDAPARMPGVTRVSYEAPAAVALPAPKPIARAEEKKPDRAKKVEHARSDRAKPDRAKSATAKADRPKPDRLKPDRAKKIEMAKADRPKSERAKPIRAKVETAKAERAKPAKPRDAQTDRARVRMADRERARDRDRDGDDTPRVRSAAYVKPAGANQKVALLDNRLLGDLGKLAANERTGGKRNR
jgi:hypothetical protein